MLQCIYKLLVWKGCLSSKQQLPDPLEFGCVIENESGLFVQQLMSQLVTPPWNFSVTWCATLQIYVKKTIFLSNEQPCAQACECKVVEEDIDICMDIFTKFAYAPVYI